MLNSYEKTLKNNKVVNSRKYYYVLDALDSNPAIARALKYTYNFERVNELSTETFDKIFEQLVKLELE